MKIKINKSTKKFFFVLLCILYVFCSIFQKSLKKSWDIYTCNKALNKRYGDLIYNDPPCFNFQTSYGGFHIKKSSYYDSLISPYSDDFFSYLLGDQIRNKLHSIINKYISNYTINITSYCYLSYDISPQETFDNILKNNYMGDGFSVLITIDENDISNDDLIKICKKIVSDLKQINFYGNFIFDKYNADILKEDPSANPRTSLYNYYLSKK